MSVKNRIIEETMELEGARERLHDTLYDAIPNASDVVADIERFVEAIIKTKLAQK